METYAYKRVLESIKDSFEDPKNAKYYEADLKRWLEFLCKSSKE